MRDETALALCWLCDLTTLRRCYLKHGDEGLLSGFDVYIVLCFASKVWALHVFEYMHSTEHAGRA